MSKSPGSICGGNNLSHEFFRRYPTSDGTGWELPRRELGEFGKFGWLMIAVCAVGFLFLLIWSAVWLMVGIGFVVDGKLWGLGIAAIGLIGVVAMFYLARLGMLGWYLVQSKTSCHVEVGSKFLFSNEPLGFFTWRRKCEIDAIKQLNIERSGTGKYSNDESKLGFAGELMTIRATTNSKPFLVAPGYRHEILSPLLTEIGDELNRHRGGSPIEILPGVSESTLMDSPNQYDLSVSGIQQEQEGKVTLRQQPADSSIEIHDTGENKAYRVLPMGIKKGSKGLLGFSIFWNLFMLVFTVIFIVIHKMGELPKELTALGASIVGLFFLVFWMVGILSLVSTINAGRRTAMLGIADGQLFVERKSIFGTKWIEVPIDNVRKINVGPSGTEINNVPVLELQIHESEGCKHGLLSQLANDDLYWLAQELTAAIESASHR